MNWLVSVFVVFVQAKLTQHHHLPPLCPTCEIRCTGHRHIVFPIVSQSFHGGCTRHFQTQTANIFPRPLISPISVPSPQVNLAIMQKQLSEMAIGHPRQSSSSSRQNGFSGGVGALGIMNNRLAETSVDR